jgi:hypothetical protein
MWCRELVAGILLAGTLGACAVVDPVDPRYDTVNRSLAKARNESILLNIIRSSHDWPMSFTTVAPKGGGKGGGTEFSRFCFDQVLAERGMKAMNPERLQLVNAKYVDHGYKRSPVCGSDWHPGKEEAEQADTLQFQVGPLTFKIVTRSTYSIYQFLGKLLKQARETNEPRTEAREGAEGQPESHPNLPREDEMVPVLSTVREDANLLRIVTQPSDECFVVTHFIDGVYCVPERGSANTKRIFALLSQLIALKTSAADLAITPAVRVVQ